MWLLEGGGVIVRRRKGVKLESRGSAPLSGFSHGGYGRLSDLDRAETKGR